jgi:hypothetical protein
LTLVITVLYSLAPLNVSLGFYAFSAVPARLREDATMIMKAGQQWNCSNPACRCEIVVQSWSDVEGGNPRCVCGAPMKKQYTPPQFSYLEFLGCEEPVPARVSSREAESCARKHLRKSTAKSNRLVLRGGAARTFASLVSFLAFLFFLTGAYLLGDAFEPAGCAGRSAFGRGTKSRSGSDSLLLPAETAREEVLAQLVQACRLSGK